MTVGALGIAGVAVAGYLVTQGFDLPGAATVSGATAERRPDHPADLPAAGRPRGRRHRHGGPDIAALQITYAGADEAVGGVVVGAYVAGLIEEGGRCAADPDLDGVSSARTESEGLADASRPAAVSCSSRSRSSPPGTWAPTSRTPRPSATSVAAGRATVEVP